MNVFGDMILAARGGISSDAGVADAKTALSDREFVEASRDLATSVVRVTGRSRPVLAVSLPLAVDALTHLLAAILGDYTLCFLDPSAPEQRREAILASLRPDAVADATGIHLLEGARSDDEVAPGYVAMSSGSTGGAPKGVLSTWSALGAFAPAGAAALELDSTARWGEISHPAYDMAMTNLLLALAAGSGLRVSGSLGDRLRPLRFIDRVQATHLRLAPRFVDLAAAEKRPAGPVRVWASGGDRFQAAHVTQLLEIGIPLVVNTYGTSETTGFASTARLTAADEIADVHGSVPIGRGSVGEWSADLVDRDDARMLRIRSPHLPRGYLFGDPGEFPRWESSDTVLTGDMGVRIGDDLYCLGRAGRRVKRNGSFVDLDDIDVVLRSAKGVVSFTVLTRSGDLISIVEGPEASDLRGELSGLLRPEVTPDALIPVRQLPRLGNGKIDHAAALEIVESAITDPAAL